MSMVYMALKKILGDDKLYFSSRELIGLCYWFVGLLFKLILRNKTGTKAPIIVYSSLLDMYRLLRQNNNDRTEPKKLHLTCQ